MPEEYDSNSVLQQVQDEIQKAVTNSSYGFSPPSRSIFAPENLDPVVKVLVPVTAPVRRCIPRSPGFGQAAGWNKLTSRLDPQAGGTGVRLGFADAGTPNETQHTFAFVTAAYKNIGRDLTIGRQALASNKGGNLEDMRAKLEYLKATEVMLGEEDIILNGDVNTQPLEFDGLAKSIVTNSGTATYLTASGIGVFARGLYNAGSENPDLIVASPLQINALANDLQGGGSIQRIVMDSQGEGVGGVRVSKIVNPISGTLIPIVASRYCGAYAYLLTVKDPTGENWLEMEDLESMSTYDVPNATHALQARVYESTVLKVIGEPYQYKITGLSLV